MIIIIIISTYNSYEDKYKTHSQLHRGQMSHICPLRVNNNHSY